MKEEYDFAKGERGKFFRENSKLNLPIYLDDEVQNYLQERARSKGAWKSLNLSTKCSGGISA